MYRIAFLLAIFVSLVNSKDLTTQLNDFADKAIEEYMESGLVAGGQGYSRFSKKYGGNLGVDMSMRDTKVYIEKMTRQGMLYEDKNFTITINNTVSRMMYFATGAIEAGSFKEKRNLTGFTNEFYVLVKFARGPGGRFSSGMPQAVVSRSIEWKEFVITDDQEEHVQEFKDKILEAFKKSCLEYHLKSFHSAMLKSFRKSAANIDNIVTPPELAIPNTEKLNSFFDSVYKETLGATIPVPDTYLWNKNHKFEDCQVVVKVIERTEDARLIEGEYEIWSRVKCSLEFSGNIDPSNKDAQGFHQVVGNLNMTSTGIGMLIGTDGKFSSSKVQSGMYFRFNNIAMLNVTKEVDNIFKDQLLWMLDQNVNKAVGNFVAKKIEKKLLQ